VRAARWGGGGKGRYLKARHLRLDPHVVFNAAPVTLPDPFYAADQDIVISPETPLVVLPAVG